MTNGLQSIDNKIPDQATQVNSLKGFFDVEAGASMSLPKELDPSPAVLCLPEGSKSEENGLEDVDDHENNSTVPIETANESVAYEDPCDDAETSYMKPESAAEYQVDEKDHSRITLSSNNDETLSDIDEEEAQDVDDDESEEEVDACSDDDEYENESMSYDSDFKKNSNGICHMIKTNWKRSLLFTIIISTILIVVSMALVCGLTNKCKNLQLNPCERECGGTFPFGCNADLPNTTKYFCHPNGGCFYANAAQKTPPYEGFCAFKTVY